MEYWLHSRFLSIHKLTITSNMTKLAALIILLTSYFKRNDLLINQIIKQSFNESHLCLLSDNLSEFGLIEIESAVTISSIENFGSLHGNCTGVILMVQNASSTLDYLLTSRSNTILNPNQRILIFCNICKIAPKLLEELQKRFLDVITAKQMLNNTKVAIKSIYTNKRIFSNSNMRKVFHIKPIDIKNIFQTAKAKFQILLCHSPPFLFTTTKNPYGIEMKIIEDVIKTWPVEYKILDNLTLDYCKETTQEQLLKAFQLNKSDLSMCGFWQKIIHDSGAEMSHFVSNMCITFLVPKPKIQNDYLFVLKPFQKLPWAVALILLVLATISSLIMLRYYKNGYQFDKILIFLHFLRLITMGSLPNLPVKNSPSLKYLILFWSIYSTLISGYFCAGITKSLEFPRFTDKIESFTDMVDQKISWDYHGDLLKEFLLQSSDNDSVRLLTETFALTESTEVTNKNIRHGKHAIIIRILQNKYVMNTFELDDYGKRNLIILPNCLINIYSAFALQRNSPFKKIINKAIENFVEHGFLNYWHVKYSNEADARFMESFFPTFEHNHTEINLKKLASAFWLLLVGYVFGVVAFLLERLHLF